MEIYGQVVGEHSQKQLSFAQKILKSHSEDYQALLAIARISRQSGLPEQAKDYYEKSLSAHPSVSAYAELAQLHAEQGNYKMSSELFARGAKLQVN